MSKYIVVTGGAGYIGSHTIIEIFQNTTYEVISIDNFSNSYEDVYERIHQITNKKVISLNIDLCNKNTLFQQLNHFAKDIQGIIHFAAYKSVPESIAEPFKYYQNNIQSLLNISEFAIQHSISNFIFSSSCSVYGDIKTSPVTENTPLPIPNSPYAHTKQIGEQILIQLVQQCQFPLKILALRYFNPVGSHTSALIGELPKYNLTGLVPNIIRAVLQKIPVLEVYGNDYATKDGTPIRDYIHVSDIAQAHVLALEYIKKISTPSYYDVINLGTGKGYTVLEVIQTFENINQVKVPYKIAPRRSGDVEAIYANNDKALQLLKWKPKYSLETMIQSAWQWGKQRY